MLEAIRINPTVLDDFDSVLQFSELKLLPASFTLPGEINLLTNISEPLLELALPTYSYALAASIPNVSHINRFSTTSETSDYINEHMAVLLIKFHTAHNY